jgi:hypothetical protein
VVDFDPPVSDPNIERGKAVGEGWRGGPGIGKVLISMPGAGDAAIHDAPFGERTTLVTANP